MHRLRILQQLSTALPVTILYIWKNMQLTLTATLVDEDVNGDLSNFNCLRMSIWSLVFLSIVVDDSTSNVPLRRWNISVKSEICCQRISAHVTKYTISVMRDKLLKITCKLKVEFDQTARTWSDEFEHDQIVFISWTLLSTSCSIQCFKNVDEILNCHLDEIIYQINKQVYIPLHI